MAKVQRVITNSQYGKDQTIQIMLGSFTKANSLEYAFFSLHQALEWD